MKTFLIELNHSSSVSIVASGLPQAWAIAKRRFGRANIRNVTEAPADPIELEIAVQRANVLTSQGLWMTAGDEKVARKFPAAFYTIDEVEQILAEMRRVQVELDRIAR